MTQRHPGQFETVWYSLLNRSSVRSYLLITGTDANYAFFAPQVSSCLLVEYVSRDKKNVEQKRSYIPYSLTTQEGIQRYAFLPYNFEKKISSAPDSSQAQLTNYLLYSLANAALNSESDNLIKSVSANLVVYNFPDHISYRNGKKIPELIDIASSTAYRH